MSIYDHKVVHLDKIKSDLLNEAYIGKTPLLIEVEKKIHDYRSKKDFPDSDNLYGCGLSLFDVSR